MLEFPVFSWKVGLGNGRLSRPLWLDDNRKQKGNGNDKNRITAKRFVPATVRSRMNCPSRPASRTIQTRQHAERTSREPRQRFGIEKNCYSNTYCDNRSEENRQHHRLPIFRQLKPPGDGTPCRMQLFTESNCPSPGNAIRHGWEITSRPWIVHLIGQLLQQHQRAKIIGRRKGRRTKIPQPRTQRRPRPNAIHIHILALSDAARAPARSPMAILEFTIDA